MTQHCARTRTPPDGTVTGELVTSGAERKTVDLISELRSNGLTLRSIADQLNRDHIRTKRGGVKWYASTVRHVLGNDIYREAA
jgi:Recombinase